MKTNLTNKIFFMFIISIFIGCKTNIYINEKVNPDNDGTRTIEQDLINNIREKKSGVYIYPQLGTKISLKKGEFNGVFQIIENNDTIFYCNFVNNLPIGRYVKHYRNDRYRYKHGRTLPSKQKIDYEDGSGFFNQQHQKEGYWVEDNERCIQVGSYNKGKKEGVWKENCFNDVGGYTIYKNIIYKNDSIINSIYGKGSLSANYKKEGYWEEYYPYCYQRGNYTKGKKIGLWEESCYDIAENYESHPDVSYKNDFIINTVPEKKIMYPNYEYKKEGYLEELYMDCYKKGNYVNGLKNGLWKEDCRDIKDYTIYKNVNYKNDTIIGSKEN